MLNVVANDFKGSELINLVRLVKKGTYGSKAESKPARKWSSAVQRLPFHCESSLLNSLGHKLSDFG
jgi:hypothetical protein